MRTCIRCKASLEGTSKKRVFCSDSCKSMYYSLRKTEKIMKDGPETFIMKELEKPVVSNENIIPKDRVDKIEKLYLKQDSNIITIHFNSPRAGHYFLYAKEGDTLKITVEVINRLKENESQNS